MRARSLVVAAAIAAALVLPAAPAQARHTCGLDDPTLNAICESHPTPRGIVDFVIQTLRCVIAPDQC